MFGAIGARRVIGLVILGVFALFAFVFGVVFPVAIFLAAMWEKRTERPLKRAGEASLAKVTPASRVIIDAAIVRGFTLLGTF